MCGRRIAHIQTHKMMTKNILFSALSLILTLDLTAQTLNQAANWPNSNWTVPANGYNPSGFTKDPRSTSQFSFDDDGAGLASIDNIWAASPTIDLTATFNANERSLEASFAIIFTSNTNADNIQLQYFDADLAQWFLWEALTPDPLAAFDAYRTCTSQNQFNSAALDISGFTATQLSGFKYRINYNDNGGWEYGYCINSPTIRSIVSCIKPSALGASNVTSTSADLGWTENNGAGAWDLELVASGASPTGTPSAANISTNPYSATGLTPSTAYDFYVRAKCGGGNGDSGWEGPFTFTTTAPPCADPSALMTSNITHDQAELSWTENGSATIWDIELITIGSTPSGSPTNPGTSNPFSATGLSPNTGYEFYVRADCGNGTSDWIGPMTFQTVSPPCNDPSDLGANNMTSDGAELFWTENGTAGVWNLKIVAAGSTPPVAPSITGASNPHVASGLSSSTAYDFYVQSDCGNGDTSNFIGPFTFTTLAGCDAPSDLGATNIFSNSAELFWTENGTSTAWEIELIPAFTSPSGVATASVGTNPYQYTNLTSSTSYDYYVRAMCGQSESSWTGPFNFITPPTPNCVDPSDLGATNIGDLDATLFWTENGQATMWDIEVLTSGSTPTGTPTIPNTTNPSQASGLTPGQAYEFYVRSICGGVTSNWVGPFEFNTTAMLEEPEFETFRIYPNPGKGKYYLEGNWEESVNIRIFDSRGTLVKAYTTSQKKILLNLEESGSGVYLVTVKTGSAVSRHRIIQR